ncbi:MAG: nitronate monooxygenase [Spirochaetota bacterium]|nr:MAG: nitronate monooxygenase [Spirochaetota bacterium]
MSLIERVWKKGKDFLGVDYPIIAGGMTWISNYELVKAVSDNKAFGVLASGNMPPDLFEEEVDRCVKGIDRPFGVNLITIAPNFEQLREILKSKQVPVVIFAGSFPRKHHVEDMARAGKRTMAFASTKSIADQMIRFGVDALILEGSEAGGHIGYVSLTILLQQVLFRVEDVPIFVAGGIATGGMVAHLLLMGAAGCQLGTRFVLSKECTAHENFKQAFIKARARQAVSTPQYDSKLPVVPVRALKNKGMIEFGKLQLKILREIEEGKISRDEAQYQVENYWVGSLKEAVINGDIDYGSLMAGQSVGLVNEIKPIKEIIDEIVSDAETELEKVKARLCI